MQVKELIQNIHPVYQNYVDLTQHDDVIETLLDHQEALEFLKTMKKTKVDYRYAQDKWSVKEIVAHLVDSETYFNSTTISLTNSDFKLKKRDWAFPNVQSYTYGDLIAILEEARKESVKLYETLNDSHWGIRGELFEKDVTVLSLGFTNVGHEIHHLNTIKERYLG